MQSCILALKDVVKCLIRREISAETAILVLAETFVRYNII